MAEQKFEKVVDYSLSRDDFMGEDEILVTITLHEYRKLIKDCSVADHEKNRLVNEKALLTTERKQLEEQNHELLKEVRSLQSIIAELIYRVAMACMEEKIVQAQIKVDDSVLTMTRKAAGIGIQRTKKIEIGQEVEE